MTKVTRYRFLRSSTPADKRRLLAQTQFRGPNWVANMNGRCIYRNCHLKTLKDGHRSQDNRWAPDGIYEGRWVEGLVWGIASNRQNGPGNPLQSLLKHPTSKRENTALHPGKAGIGPQWVECTAQRSYCIKSSGEIPVSHHK